MYGIPGKFTEYKPEWNNISLFSDKESLEEYIEYSKQDSICLLEAIYSAKKFI